MGGVAAVLLRSSAGLHGEPWNASLDRFRGGLFAPIEVPLEDPSPSNHLDRMFLLELAMSKRICLRWRQAERVASHVHKTYYR